MKRSNGGGAFKLHDESLRRSRWSIFAGESSRGGKFLGQSLGFSSLAGGSERLLSASLVVLSL